MILGVGTDLLDMRRMEKACSRESFINRIFTPADRREAADHISWLAGDFAVKEAVSKAFGTGFRGMEPKDIEVLRDELGKPHVRLYGGAAGMASAKKVRSVHVSITDEGYYCMAFAVIEGE